MKNQFPKKYWSGNKDSKGMLDLGKYIIESYIKYGGNNKNIVDKRECTYKEIDKYYSHRRDKGNTGRMLAIAYRK